MAWVALSSATALADEAAVRIASIYAPRTAHVQTVGTLFNGTAEIGNGSGLLVGQDLILTNNHVIPQENNYKSLQIQIRLKSRLTNPRTVAEVHRDPDRDLALLVLSTPVSDVGGDQCPMPVIREEGLAPMGATIYVLGFPLNEDLGITDGLISTHEAGHGRWRTNNLITYGNSGGPAFDRRGALVGIAVGGVGSFTIGGETRDVDGINFIIPSVRLAESPLFQKILAVPQPVRCWRDLFSGPDASTPVPSMLGPPDSIRLPETLTRSFTVAETKDDHPIVLAPHGRDYERRFRAEPGYRITQCATTHTSVNHASDETCNIEPGGESAVLRFRLESGPAVDRWRGWWGGVVTLEQRRASP